MVRKLGGLEKFFFQRSDLNLHSCFSVGVKLNQLPSKEVLSVALSNVIQSHYQLHCNCFEEEGELVIKPIDKIAFDDVVEYQSWDQYEEEEINFILKNYNFKYRVQKPIWKIIVVPKTNCIILALDHLVSDGMSTVLFFKELLKQLSSIDSNSVDKIKDILYEYDPTFDIKEKCHPYEDLPIPFSWKIKRPIVKTLFSLSPTTVVSQDNSLIHFKDYKLPDDFLDPTNEGDEPYYIRNNHRQVKIKLTPEQLNSWRLKCKEHNVTITAYLISVFYKALGQIDKTAYEGEAVKIEVPMNTRQRLGSDRDFKESFGAFVAGLEFKESLDFDRDVWDMAKEVTNIIQQKANDEIMELINEVRLLELVDTRKFMKLKMDNARNPYSTFEVTNIGFQDFGVTNADKYQVEDAFFNEPQLFGHIMTYSAISTPKGGLTCYLAYPRNLDKEMNKYYDYINESLTL